MIASQAEDEQFSGLARLACRNWLCVKYASKVSAQTLGCLHSCLLYCTGTVTSSAAGPPPLDHHHHSLVHYQRSPLSPSSPTSSLEFCCTFSTSFHTRSSPCFCPTATFIILVPHLSIQPTLAPQLRISHSTHTRPQSHLAQSYLYDTATTLSGGFGFICLKSVSRI